MPLEQPVLPDGISLRTYWLYCGLAAARTSRSPTAPQYHPALLPALQIATVRPGSPFDGESEMPDDLRQPAIDKSRLPSRHVTVGPERAPHRAFLYSMRSEERRVGKECRS